MLVYLCGVVRFRCFGMLDRCEGIKSKKYNEQ